MSEDQNTSTTATDDDDEFGLKEKPKPMDLLFAAMRKLSDTPEYKQAEEAAGRAGVRFTLTIAVDSSGLARSAKPG